MKQKLNKQETGFTQVKNNVLNDTKLSLKGKGLYAYLFSKPEDWDFAYDRIAKELDIGTKQVRSGLVELEESGYLERIKKSDGRVTYYLNWDKKPSAENRHEEKKPGAYNGKQPKRQVAETGTISNIDKESNKEVESKSGGDPPQEEKVEEITYPCIHFDKDGGKVCANKKMEGSDLCKHHAVQEIIDMFKPVNESYLEFYGKKTQHAAVVSLIKTYPKVEIQWMIKTAPAYNKMPFRAKGDKVYSPYDLLKNWSVMKDNLISYKLQLKQKDQQSTKEVV